MRNKLFALLLAFALFGTYACDPKAKTVEQSQTDENISDLDSVDQNVKSELDSVNVEKDSTVTP